jgi:hypothetical protein
MDDGKSNRADPGGQWPFMCFHATQQTMCIHRLFRFCFSAPLCASPVLAQGASNPFATPIAATEGVITVKFVEFATIPDISGEAPRMMLLVDEPGTRRMFVNTMRGPLHSVSYDGKTVTEYLEINAPTWGVSVQRVDGKDARGRRLRRRRAARDLQSRAPVSQSQRGHDRVQPAGEARQ